MARKTLSVVMPNFNHARFIREAIEAIAGQTRPPDEFLILDDCSTDNSMDIIAEYAARFPFLRFFQNPKNLGVVKTVERLLNEATGDYVLITSADDCVCQGYFEKAMAMAETHPEAGLVCGKMVLFGENFESYTLGLSKWKTPRYATPREFLTDVLLVERLQYSQASSTIFRRELFTEMGGYRPELGCFGDLFLFRAMALKHGLCYLPVPGMRFRVSQESFSHAIRNNPLRWLNYVFRTIHRMKQPPFREIFPREYIFFCQKNALTETVLMCGRLLFQLVQGVAGRHSWIGTVVRFVKDFLKFRVLSFLFPGFDPEEPNGQSLS